ncbi:MAG: KdsC family phosphatase [Cellvibrionaceae bacterium]
MNEKLTEQLLTKKATKIQLLLLDVDGVLTDGKLYFSNSNDEYKAFNILDGHGIKMLQENGVMVGIVTGRESNIVSKRAADLGIKVVIQGSPDKQVSVQDIAKKHNIDLDNIAFMGDDYPDLPAMNIVGLSLSVANAHRAVAARVDWQSKKNGGEGAVREACDLLMQAQGKYDSALQKYL